MAHTCTPVYAEYRELAEESGIEHWGRVPALNTNSLFIGDLADAVLEALPYMGQLAKPSDALVPQGGCGSGSKCGCVCVGGCVHAYVRASMNSMSACAPFAHQAL